MPRKRMIDPEFWSDEKVTAISFLARLLFIGMWNFADDEGLIKFTPEYLSSMIFPYDNISRKKMLSIMQELINAKFIFPYVGKTPSHQYAYIINFRKHQNINRPQPSKIPPPSIQNPRVREMYFERDGWICHICGEEIDKTARPDLPNSKAPSIDHVIPKNKGGTDYPSNIRAAHISCNKSRGDKFISEYVGASLNKSLNDSVINSSLIEINKNLKEEKDIYVDESSTPAHQKNTDDFKKWCQSVISQWNEFAQKAGLPAVRDIAPGSKRERFLRARFKEKEFDFQKILEKVGQSEFLLGIKTDWKVSFDWILAPSNYLKILEGTYDSGLGSRDKLKASNIGSKEYFNHPEFLKACERQHQEIEKGREE